MSTTLPKDPLSLAAHKSACQLLNDAAATMPGKPIDPIQVTDGFHVVRITVEPCRYGLGEQVQDPPVARQQELPGPAILSHLDQLILANATTEPQTMQKLANRCNHDVDSYFRSRVSRMVNLGLLERGYRGIRRA